MDKPRLLRADEIETRVSRYIEGKGLSLLLYKTARVDMDILDETFGPENWANYYEEIKGNLFCCIAVKGVCKWDCGKETFSDAEKGEASDAFKRAGFRWGIGRELYSAPFIWIDEKFFDTKISNGKKVPKDSFIVTEITYTENRKIDSLVIVNARTKRVVFQNGGNLNKNRANAPRNQNNEETPAEAGKGVKWLICADCGGEIESAEMANGTKRTHGRQLCRECGIKAMQKKKGMNT